MEKKEVLEIIEYCEKNQNFKDTQLHKLAISYLKLLEKHNKNEETPTEKNYKKLKSILIIIFTKIKSKFKPLR